MYHFTVENHKIVSAYKMCADQFVYFGNYKVFLKLPQNLYEVAIKEDGHYITDGEKFLGRISHQRTYAMRYGQLKLYEGIIYHIVGQYWFSTIGDYIVYSDDIKLYTEEEAKRIKEDSTQHHIALLYGSAYYGQSKDNDIVTVVGYGEQMQQKIKNFAEINNISDIHAVTWLKGKKDYTSLNQHLHFFDVLIVQCLKKEYIGINDLLKGNYDLYINADVKWALNENLKRRKSLAEILPVDFPLRKYVFALLQARAYENKKVFVDNKIDALKYATLQEKSIFKNILFHEDVNIKKLYKLLFNADYPHEIDKAIMGDDYYYVFMSGKIFKGSYDSNWGWDRTVILNDKIKIGSDAKVVDVKNIPN